MTRDTGVSLTDAQLAAACELIADGMSYVHAAERIGACRRTLLAGLHSDRCAAQYARAREIRAAADAEQIESDDAELRRLASDVQREDGVDPARAAQAIRALSETIGTRKWLAERRSKNLWGQRQQIEHTGAGGGPVEIVERIKIVGVRPEKTDND